MSKPQAAHNVNLDGDIVLKYKYDFNHWFYFLNLP